MKFIPIILYLVPSVLFAQIEGQQGMLALTIDFNQYGHSGTSSSNHSDFGFSVIGGPVIKDKYSTGVILGYSKGSSSYSSTSYSNEGAINIYKSGLYGRYYGRISDRVYIYGNFSLYTSWGESIEDNNPGDNYKISGFTLDLRPAILFLTKPGIGIEVSYPFIGYLVSKEKHEDEQYDDVKSQDFYFNTIPGLINLTVSYYFRSNSRVDIPD